MVIMTLFFYRIVVNGVTNTKDIKIVQGRVISDWWRKKGHSVGIEDIQDILDFTYLVR